MIQIFKSSFVSLPPELICTTHVGKIIIDIIIIVVARILTLVSNMIPHYYYSLANLNSVLDFYKLIYSHKAAKRNRVSKYNYILEITFSPEERRNCVLSCMRGRCGNNGSSK